MDTLYKEACEHLTQQNGLIVLGRGLGLNRLIITSLLPYIRATTTQTAQPKLVLIVNASANFHSVLSQCLFPLGLSPNQIPKNITNEIPMAERSDLYRNKGCYIITSRILLIDLLSPKSELLPASIDGIFICNAHNIHEISTETFIFRLYKSKNKLGFMRAFTDEPESLARELNGIERLLKSMYMGTLYLYPRSHPYISHLLQTRQPDVEELVIPYSKSMTIVQQTLFILLETLLKEMKKSCSLINEDIVPLTLEKCMFSSFDHLIRKQLDNDWYKVPSTTKQLITDVSSVRKLLDYLISYDAIDLYSYLQAMKTSSTSPTPLPTSASSSTSISHSTIPPSLWLTTQSANILFDKSLLRIYTLQNYPLGHTSIYKDYTTKYLKYDKTITPTLEIPPKWTALYDVMTEIKSATNFSTTSTAANTVNRTVIVVRNERTASLVKDIIAKTPAAVVELKYRLYVSQRCASIRSHLSSKKKQVKPVTTSTTVSDDDILKIGFSSSDLKQLKMEEALLLVEERYLQDNAYSVKKQRTGTDKINKDSKSIACLDSQVLTTSEMQSLDTSFSNDCSGFGGVDEEDDFELCSCDPVSEMLVITHSKLKDNHELMDLLEPNVIILYDVDIDIVRIIELYQSHLDTTIKVYFLMYETSIEEHRYVNTIKNEKKVFEQLAKNHSNMVISLPDDQDEIEKDRREEISYTVDNSSLEVIAIANRKKAKTVTSRIIIDVRELRSSLPNILHSQGIEIVPITLTIGDYILSPLIAVERKGISDLFQSFQSGRLYSQIDTMLKFYKHTCLLIEFSLDKAFILQSSADIKSEIKVTHICAKMAMLVLAFPSLRILWSKSAYTTASLFRSLKLSHDEPSEELAQKIGASETSSADDNNNDTNDSKSYRRNKNESDRDTAIEVLLTLPGVNQTNYRAVMSKVSSLAALCKCSESELSELIGAGNAKKLFTFLHHRIVVNY